MGRYHWGNVIKDKISCQLRKSLHKSKENKGFITERSLTHTTMHILGIALQITKTEGKFSLYS